MDRVFLFEYASLIKKTEEATFALYKAALKPYADKFANYGASMTVSLDRIIRGTDSDPNHEIDTSYKAYISCVITDSKGCIIESIDRDMYMDFAWSLSTCVKGCVYVSTEIDSELFDIMQTCERYFSRPY